MQKLIQRMATVKSKSRTPGILGNLEILAGCIFKVQKEDMSGETSKSVRPPQTRFSKKSKDFDNLTSHGLWITQNLVLI